MRTLLLTFLLMVTFAGADDPFVERGFPAHDREWLPADYEKAAGLFRAPGAELLTLTDKTAALYFARLNSSENFAFLRNKKLPIEQRLPGFMAMQGAHTEILKRYFTPASAGREGQKYPSEVACLLAFALCLSAEGI